MLKQTVAFNALLFILFCLIYFSCYNIVAKFYCLKLYLSCLCLRVLWSQLQCFTYTWSRFCWCMSPQKLLFCYHLPTRGLAGVKLGDAWYVSNISIIFYAPCLFYTNYPMFYLCFGTLFMHFPELTYWQDATVQVPVFCCFWFQKSYIGNILGIGRDKSQCSYFYCAEAKDRRRVKDGSQGGHTMPRRGLPLARA